MHSKVDLSSCMQCNLILRSTHLTDLIFIIPDSWVLFIRKLLDNSKNVFKMNMFMFYNLKFRLWPWLVKYNIKLYEGRSSINNAILGNMTQPWTWTNWFNIKTFLNLADFQLSFSHSAILVNKLCLSVSNFPWEIRYEKLSNKRHF